MTKQPKVWHAGAICAALMAFASISTDFYLPAMPAMARALGSDAGAMEFTVTGYLIGLSLGQLFWGPASDKSGRRMPVAIGLLLFIIGSAGCGLSTDVTQVIIWRIVQAFGASASIVLSRAIVSDLYEGPRAAQIMSMLMAVMTAAPIIAPSIGAQLVGIWSWRAIFALLVIIGVVTLVALFTLPETLPDETRRNAKPVSKAFVGYARLTRHAPIMGFALICGFYYLGMFAYVAGTPTAFIDHHHLSPAVYGLVFAACVIGVTSGNLMNARIVAHLGMLRTLRIGATMAAIFGIILAIVARTDFGGPVGLFIPLFGFLACSGFIVPNALSGALEHTTGNAGAVSALCGAIQYGGGIFGSALVGLFADGTAWPFGWVVALGGVGALAASLLLNRGPAVEAAPS